MSSNLERARDLFSRGLEEHLAKRWREAERLYREALALAPGRPSLVFNLARLSLDQERDAEAEQLFMQVLQVSADDPEARYNLGVSLARQGRFEEALASYDRAIALRPDFAEAHSSRGVALGKLGRHEAALESHARSIELQPDSADFQASFCRCASIRALDERKLPVATLERAVLACLAARNVDYQALGRLSAVILRPKARRLGLELEGQDSEFFRAPRIQLCNDPLLLGSLEKIQIADRTNEALFTRIRSGSAAVGGARQACRGHTGSGRTAHHGPRAAVLPERVCVGRHGRRGCAGRRARTQARRRARSGSIVEHRSRNASRAMDRSRSGRRSPGGAVRTWRHPLPGSAGSWPHSSWSRQSNRRSPRDSRRSARSRTGRRLRSRRNTRKTLTRGG